MKKSILVISLIVLALSLGLPQLGHTGGHYGGHGHGYPGWWAAGAFVGGVVLGTAISRPWYPPPPVYYYPAPAPVYVYPRPVYVYPPPREAYAYPDPDSAPRPRNEAPPGEWVMVPGQWVDGKWVPSHKAWVPVNP
jgi:hypothetical protein